MFVFLQIHIVNIIFFYPPQYIMTSNQIEEPYIITMSIEQYKRDLILNQSVNSYHGPLVNYKLPPVSPQHPVLSLPHLSLRRAKWRRNILGIK